MPAIMVSRTSKVAGGLAPTPRDFRAGLFPFAEIEDHSDQ